MLVKLKSIQQIIFYEVKMYLKVNDGNKDWYYKFVDKKEITIGRGSSNDIVLKAEGVSRIHLKVLDEAGEFFIEDQGATNGTFINDEKVEPKSKISFNTFFPVQLGFFAKLHLCDESNISALEDQVAKTIEDLKFEE